ncbi:GNAT family N-acetyltransferase [Reichenbachiella carrageenanivorans]|uniref:GNAT family N-acetyltransferase n=1 Tax=Reichenbachiella carrageenanivorans TaxID=2979869 RepID=A0ABY6D5H3_9BACT|nr:GNAT family N-acetyltransferase [Reichenbachiella carrageenanivorans]UXX81353.1 GNAT family N-acetyltransferase [Reichenbachiella carrageenanivorans]
MDYVIDPVDRQLLKSELNAERFVRDTKKGGNKIYFINAHNSPHTMREIGRLREISFASAGGGTGKEVDIDEFDINEKCYQQLLVYSPEDEEIVGGYRFIDCSQLDLSDPKHIELSTAHYFDFSDQFVNNYLPHTLELGRSWIQPKYQPHIDPRKGIFALDNLWDGLGAIYVTHPGMKHFFGKVTMYPNYNLEARDAVLYFMDLFFADKEKLVTPKAPLPYVSDITALKTLLKDKNFKEGMNALNSFCKERGERVPPLIKNYMSLSPTMKAFGAAKNPDFGSVEETGILITVSEIYDSKKDRYTKY